MRGVVKSGACGSRVVDRGRLACGGPRSSRVWWTAGVSPASGGSSRWTHGGPEARGPLVREQLDACSLARGRLACGGPRASRPPRVARVVGRTAGQRPAVHWSASRWTRARWLAGVSRVVDRGRLARLGSFESLSAQRARGPRSTGWRAGRVCWRPACVSYVVDRLASRPLARSPGLLDPPRTHCPRCPKPRLVGGPVGV